MKKPDVKDIEQMEELIRINDASKRYFFQNAGKRWLQPLHEKGYFDFGKMDTKYKFPTEILYLKRMVKEAPECVLEIILSQKISKEGVYFVFFLGGEMQQVEQVGRMSEKIVSEGWIEEGLQEGTHPTFLVYLYKIFKVLEKGKDYKNLFLLFGCLVKAMLSRGEVHRNPFDYFERISGLVFDSTKGSDVAHKCFEFLVGLFFDLIKNNADAFDDFSFWCTSGGFDLRHTILRKLANLLSDYSRVISADLVRALYSQRLRVHVSDSSLFFRFIFFVLSLRGDAFREEMKGMLMLAVEAENLDIFSHRCVRVDFEFMLSNHLDLLSDAEKDEYINAILGILSKKKMKEVLGGRLIDVGSRIFSLIQKCHGLNDEQKEWVRSAGFSLRAVELSDFYPIGDVRVGFVDEKSPISFKDCAILQIVEKLQGELHPRNMKTDDHYGFDEKWDDKAGVFVKDSSWGVGGELKIDIARRFAEYMQYAEKFFDREKMPAFYTYSFFSGCLNFIKNNKERVQDDDLLSILDLCVVIVESGRRKEFIDKKPSGWDDEVNHYWNGVHREMCSVLNGLVQCCSEDFFKKNKGKVFEILQYLLSHKQPTIEDESPETAIIGSGEQGYTVGSPLAVAINTVRGSAFGVFINFICKDYVISNKVSDDVKRVFEDLVGREKTKSVRFMFGYYSMFLYDRDQEWVTTMLPKIFKKEKEDLYPVAWEGYLSQAVFKKMFFDAYLQDMYKENIKAEKVERDMEYAVDLAERLGQHIALAFINFSEFDLDHELFAFFFKNATEKAKKGVVSAISYFIFENRINEARNKGQTIDRIGKIWDYLIDNENVEVLKEVGSWLRMSEKNNILSPVVFFDKVLRTLRKTNGEINEGDLFIYCCEDALSIFAVDCPEKVFEIIELYLLNNEIHYLGDGWFGIFQILQKLVDQVEFKGLVSKLLQKGPEFSKLNDLDFNGD
ncbi:MAG: hypothetical protein OXB96_02580 [Candidatus Kaiserbacteria bacterium]|nr:hypothetical protein [Candidatus Kaiserbacteria bacterium]